MIAPLVPPDVDLRDLDGFMLNVERLLASELWALSSGEAFKAAVSLWCRAWKQVPAASLPNDNQVLASFAGLRLPAFNRVRALAMRGFVLCDDGRWYHHVLALDALRAWDAKQRHQAARKRDADRLQQWRERKKNDDETHFTPGGETHFTPDNETPPETITKREHRQDTGQDRTGTGKAVQKLKAVQEPGQLLPKPRSNGQGTRLPENWILPDDWKAWSLNVRPDWDEEKALRESLVFRDHWHGKAGKDARKEAWFATWRNWTRRAR
jgi:hypothetical protein